MFRVDAPWMVHDVRQLYSRLFTPPLRILTHSEHWNLFVAMVHNLLPTCKSSMGLCEGVRRRPPTRNAARLRLAYELDRWPRFCHPAETQRAHLRRHPLAFDASRVHNEEHANPYRESN